jgi:NitT/TauT family transport system substrate-binding protein
MIGLLARLGLALSLLVLLPFSAIAQSRAVTLAVQPNADIPQLLLAIERNLWKAQGLDVKVITFATGRESLEALLGGQADFAVLTEYPATIAALRGQKFQVLADMSRYAGLRAIASKKWMNLTSFKDLDGKKIATTLGTNAEYTTHVMLQEGGAKAQVVNAAPADTVPALVRGDVQAAVMFPSLYAQARKLLGGDYQEVRTKAYVGHTLLVGTSSVIAGRPAEVEAFVKALLEADKMVAGDPKLGQATVITALKGVMNPDTLAEMWPEYDYKFELKPEVLELMSKQGGWILERGFVKAPPETASSKALRGYIAEGTLAKLAPGAVTLR